MVKVSIQVRSGAASFDVAVSAENVEQAVALVGGCYPGRDVRVKLPIYRGTLGKVKGGPMV